MNAVTLSKEYEDGNRNFQGFQLSGVNLGWSTLIGANFSNADLYGANLSGASLRYANLSGNTNLAFTDLSRADLTGADLRGSNLEGANLQGTILNNTIYDEKTRFPKGFNPDTTEAINIDLKEQDSSEQKTDLSESLTFSRNPVYSQKAKSTEHKISKTSRKSSLDWQKTNHTSNHKNSQSLGKSDTDYNANKSASFLLKILVSTLITLILGGCFLGVFFLSLSNVFESQQKILKQSQDNVKKVETQNNQVAKDVIVQGGNAN
jgi:Pentapeptide repeats (8 copies)